MTASQPAFEDRLAALETEVERLKHPLILDAAPLSDEDVVKLRADFEVAAKDWSPRFVRYFPPSVFDPDQVKTWLRECVTVVRPEETLVILGRDFTPNQVHEYQRVMDAATGDGYIPFKVLIVGGDELGVVEACGERP